MPYFRVAVLPEAYFGIPLESHVPGRHLNALLNAEDAGGLEVEEEVIEKFANACFYSYSGPVPFPLDRERWEVRVARGIQIRITSGRVSMR